MRPGVLTVTAALIVPAARAPGGRADTIGRIKRGAYADRMAVGGDPRLDGAVLERVGFVMKGGRIVHGAPQP